MTPKQILQVIEAEGLKEMRLVLMITCETQHVRGAGCIEGLSCSV